MANWYVGSVAWTGVTAWAALTAYVSTANGGRGDYRRQLATPAVGSERVFRCTTSGTSGAAEPTWNITRNATTNDGTAVWTECTGQEADQTSGVAKTAPHARIANAEAATWAAAGDTVYFDSNHAETVSATSPSQTLAGTDSAPGLLVCVSATSSVPPVSANLATTGSSSTTLSGGTNTLAGIGYVYGLILNGGTAGANANINVAGSAAAVSLVCQNCKFNVVSASASGGGIFFSPSGAALRANVELYNCALTFGNATLQFMSVRSGTFLMRGGSVALTGSVPTAGMFLAQQLGMTAIFDGVDLSAFGSGTILVAAAIQPYQVYFINCKLGASVTVASTPTARGAAVYVVSSDSAGTNYFEQKYTYDGTQIQETTIVRVGGATNGTTPISRKITTTANSKWFSPFTCVPITIWNTKITGNLTVTVEGIWSGGAPAVPNNDDIWMDVEYYGSAASPISTINSGTKADFLATGTAQTASTVSWASSPSTPTKFKMVSTFTAPAMAGPLYIYIRCALPSTVFYVDPLVTLV